MTRQITDADQWRPARAQVVNALAREIMRSGWVEGRWLVAMGRPHLGRRTVWAAKYCAERHLVMIGMVEAVEPANLAAARVAAIRHAARLDLCDLTASESLTLATACALRARQEAGIPDVHAMGRA